MGIIEELRQVIETAWQWRQDEGCGCCSGGGDEANRIEALEKARELVSQLATKGGDE